MKKEAIERLVSNSEDFTNHICPRCGKAMESEDAVRIISHYANVLICSDCGIDESINSKDNNKIKDEFSTPFAGWKIYKDLLKNLDTARGRARFIANMESGIYVGENVDGERVVVISQQGCGMDIKTIHISKPNWYEVVNYDVDGEQEGVEYEAVGKRK